MKSSTRWFLPIMVLLAMLLVACGGAAAEPTPAPAPTTAGTSQGDDEADDAEATRAPLPTTAPTEEATEEAEPTAAPTEESDDDDDDDASSGDRVAIEDAEDIESYRFRAEITVEGEAFEGDDEMAMFAEGITMEGAFVKDPKASDVHMEIPGIGEVGFRDVDGKSYANFGGEWTETSSGEVFSVEDFTPISDDDLGGDLERFEEVGDEEVNGRDTTHYRGDKEVLQDLAEEGDDDSFDFADAEEAQLDVWLDQEYGFVVKMDLVAEGAGLNEDEPDAEGRVEVAVEYYDFNEPIEIEAPEVVADGDDSSDDSDDSDSGDTDDTSDASTLPELLGFDFDLPEGAEADVSFGTATLTLPMPLDEAQALIVEAFEGAGYELDPDLSAPDAGILWYDNGEQQWYITLTETDGVTEVFIF